MNINNKLAVIQLFDTLKMLRSPELWGCGFIRNCGLGRDPKMI